MMDCETCQILFCFDTNFTDYTNLFKTKLRIAYKFVKLVKFVFTLNQCL
jgi:hypothetical protein